MVAGNNRHYHLGERITWTFTRPKANAAIWAVWKAAAPRNQSVTLVEPDGTTHTVVITGFSDPISRTEVAAGNYYRDLTITCETL
jgi:VCBS repeat-containing protein